MKIIFDVETTGLNFTEDEILQLSIIDDEGNELFSHFMKPVNKFSWMEAQAVHGISPHMVAFSKTFAEYKDEIQAIFDEAEELIGYNASFDIEFLKAAGIEVPDVPLTDVMLEFAPIFGEWSDYYEEYKWQKLTTCAAYYGYTYKAHDALEDVRATLHCYKCMRRFDDAA